MAAVLPHSSSPIRPPRRSPSPRAMERISRAALLSFSSLGRKERKLSTTICFCVKPEKEEGREGGGDSLTDSLVSSVGEDSEYLWKLAGGTVGGASAIKYGSILFPEITRPNIIKGLLMISLPMLVAALILIKESYTQTQNEDLL